MFEKNIFFECKNGTIITLLLSLLLLQVPLKKSVLNEIEFSLHILFYKCVPALEKVPLC